MTKEIEKIVSGAKSRLEGTGDTRTTSNPEDMLILLKDGATPISINEQMGKNNHFSEIIHGYISYVISTDKPIEELEEYRP